MRLRKVNKQYSKWKAYANYKQFSGLRCYVAFSAIHVTKENEWRENCLSSSLYVFDPEPDETTPYSLVDHKGGIEEISLARAVPILRQCYQNPKTPQQMVKWALEGNPIALQLARLLEKTP